MRHQTIFRLVAGTLLILLVFGAAPKWADAATSAQVPVGPRAIGMGGAFSAVADDASALFWNPAGLALIGHEEATASNADLFGLGIRSSYASVVFPLSPIRAAAIDWASQSFEDEELRFEENRVGFGFATRLVPRTFVGATGRWTTRHTGLDGFDVRRGSGFGADLGLMVTPFRGMRASLVSQDAFNSRISYDDGESAEAYHRNLRFGASYAIARRALVACDVDDRWHLGAEARPISPLALRAGVQRGRHEIDGTTWSFGVGLRVKWIRFDYARLQPPTLDPTDHYGVSIEFNLNPSIVKIERVEPREIYASLYRSYDRDTVAIVRVYNNSEEPVAASVRMHVPGLTSGDGRPQTVQLRPKVFSDIALPGAFGQGILDIVEDQAVPLDIAVQYESRRRPRVEKRIARGYVFAPGAIDWSQGVEQAAAYVTYRDPAVESMGRQVGRLVAEVRRRPELRRALLTELSPNVAYIAALSAALGQLGVAYVPDPKNPYSTVSAQAHSTDNVNYPHQTLASRAGDCDDSSVLMAALLANLGVRSAFLDAPGHLFLLAATGIPERDRQLLDPLGQRSIVRNGEVWVPIETTDLSLGFSKAWAKGSGSYREWDSRGAVRIIDVTRSQERYPPGSPGGARANIALEGSALIARLEDEGRELAAWFSATDESRRADDRGTRLRLARHSLLDGDKAAAREQLERLAAVEPNSPTLLNDLAVVLAANGEMSRALELLSSALAVDSTDAGLWLNAGMILHASGDSTTAHAAFERGVETSGGIDAATRMMGLLPDDDEDTREGIRRIALEEVRRLLESVRRTPRRRAPAETAPEKVMLPSTRPVVQQLGDRAQLIRTRVGITKSGGLEELYRYLYWRGSS